MFGGTRLKPLLSNHLGSFFSKHRRSGPGSLAGAGFTRFSWVVLNAAKCLMGVRQHRLQSQPSDHSRYCRAIRRPRYTPPAVPRMPRTNAVVIPTSTPPSHQPNQPPMVAPTNAKTFDISYGRVSQNSTVRITASATSFSSCPPASPENPSPDSPSPSSRSGSSCRRPGMWVCDARRTSCRV